jgi:hypothetical protein
MEKINEVIVLIEYMETRTLRTRRNLLVERIQARGGER